MSTRTSGKARLGLLLCGAIFLSGQVHAQENGFTCGTHSAENLLELHGNDPAILQAIHQAESDLEDFTRNDAARGGGEIVIPVVFHVIHMNGPENISDEQLRDAIRVLNNDFNRLNTDWEYVRPEFLDLVADVGVSFRLASLDPDGNCTNGITRTASPLTYEGDQEMKDLVIWPRDRYLNIWVAASANGAAGYTNYPSSVSGPWGEGTDGIVVLHTYTGSMGTSSIGRSRVLTHEVGHWINLKHTWGDSNEPGEESNCGMDDNVGDTPNTIGWTSCNLSGASCGSPLDNVENYMEYSYCCRMFTLGQKARMLAALNSSTAGRSNLWTVANRQLTGTWTEPGLCEAMFDSNLRTICAGDSVDFTDQSYSNVQNWNWSFPGGEPANSVEQMPTVRYMEPGTYTVGLVVGDGVGTVSTEQVAYITVLPSTGEALPFQDDFEASTVPGEIWSTMDGGNDGTFTLSNAAAFSGSHSVKLTNHGAMEGTVDELITTTMDLSGLEISPVLSFRYAFRQRNSSNDDELRVYMSGDCGRTWNLRAILGAASSLSTVPPGWGSFTPTTPEQWGYREVDNFLPGLLGSDVRFKFRFISDGGSNFWLDDVNVNGSSVGLEGMEQLVPSGVVMPNPAREEAVLVLPVREAGRLQVDLLDPLGRAVTNVRDAYTPAGELREPIPMSTLASGVYLVRIRQHGAERTLRLVKQD